MESTVHHGGGAFWRMAAIILLAVSVLLALTRVNPASPSAPSDVKVEIMSAALQEGRLIVDVRTPGEYAAGHLVGAILLPHEGAAEALARLVPDRDAPIALYCRSGRRSGLVQEELKTAGYTRAENWGGFEELAKTRAAVRLADE